MKIGSSRFKLARALGCTALCAGIISSSTFSSFAISSEDWKPICIASIIGNVLTVGGCITLAVLLKSKSSEADELQTQLTTLQMELKELKENRPRDDDPSGGGGVQPPAENSANLQLINSQKAQIGTLESKVQTLESELEEAKKKLQEKDQPPPNVPLINADMQSKLKEAQNKVKQKQTQIEEITKKFNESTQKCKNLEEKLDKMQNTSMNKFQTQLDGVVQNTKQTQGKMEAEHKRELAKKEEQIKLEKQKSDDLQKQLDFVNSNLNKEISELRNENKQLNKELSLMKETAQKKGVDLEKFTTKTDEVPAEVQNAKEFDSAGADALLNRINAQMDSRGMGGSAPQNDESGSNLGKNADSNGS